MRASNVQSHRHHARISWRITMRLAVLGSAILLALSSSALAQNTIERPFVPGGHIRLQLASGDYVVRAGATDRVVVHWTPGDEARTKDLKKLSVAVQVSGSTATIVTAGPARHVNVVIEIPERSDLHVRMRAGDIRLQG